MTELNYARAASQGKRSNTNIRSRPITETIQVGPDSNIEILQEFFEKRPGATSSSTRRTEQAYFRFRLTADNHFMVVLPPAVDPHEFMETHRSAIDSYIESLNELDSAGRKVELEELFLKLAERDEQVRNSVVGALTHAQETVEPMLAQRDNLIPKMTPCYIAAAMREAINEPSKVLYEAFGRVSELENHFPPDALRRLSDKTSVFKIVRESLSLLAAKEDSIEGLRDQDMQNLYKGLFASLQDRPNEVSEKWRNDNSRNDREQVTVLRVVAYCGAHLLHAFEKKIKEIDEALGSLAELIAQDTTGKNPAFPLPSYQACLDGGITSSASVEGALKPCKWDLEGTMRVKNAMISRTVLQHNNITIVKKNMEWLDANRPAIALLLSRSVIRGVFRRTNVTYDHLNEDVHLHWEERKADILNELVQAINFDNRVGKSKSNTRYQKDDPILVHNLMLQGAKLEVVSGAAKELVGCLKRIGSSRSPSMNAVTKASEIFPVKKGENGRLVLGQPP